MAFDSNLSGTTELDARLIQAYYQEFIISGNLERGIQSLATFKESINGKAEEFVLYTKLTKQTSAMTEDNEATSQSMADTKKTITPAEYGTVVTQTRLVQLQSGDMATRGAFATTGVNMRESVENKMILIGEAGSNELIVTQAAEGSLVAGNTMTAAYVNYAFNKLRRVGIPQPYFAVAHPDVVYDLKVETTNGGWLTVNEYNPDGRLEILDGEIGKFGGFRWIESPLVSVNADAGASAVDTYHSQFFGANAFGYVESEAPHPTIAQNDKMNRFYHIGWYGVYEFGLVDTNAHWLVTSASSIGSNT
jgi:N4-gp56 family major capsid protein